MNMSKNVTLLASTALLLSVGSIQAESFNSSLERAKTSYMQSKHNTGSTSSSTNSMPFMDGMTMPWDNSNMTMPWDMGKNSKDGNNSFSMPFSNNMSMPWNK